MKKELVEKIQETVYTAFKIYYRKSNRKATNFIEWCIENDFLEDAVNSLSDHQVKPVKKSFKEIFKEYKKEGDGEMELRDALSETYEFIQIAAILTDYLCSEIQRIID